MLLRFIIALVLSIVCLTSSACADIKPAVDTSRIIAPNTRQLRKNSASQPKKETHPLKTDSACCTTKAQGVPQDYGQAKEWFEKAAKQGHAGAQVNLGTLYLHGDGAPQSAQMALFWFSRAAEQGDALAFAKLGLMYAQGRGVLQDFIQAHMWYNLAAANGEKKQPKARDALAKQMTPGQIAEAQKRAREWKPTNKSVAWKFRTPSDNILETRRRITDASHP